LTIVSRTRLWWAAVIIVVAVIAAADRRLFLKVDYVLLFTFLFFFIFSSSVTANQGIADFLGKAVAGREYWWAIGLSQIISNVPASIVLYPFSQSNAGLIYGADTAGLCSLIGSLASVINYRIYVREYPGQGKRFIKVFTLISWAFFAIVVIPGLLLSAWEM
jgi:Na+/H+ antiporter NhaD/arsenite permease-like protein